MTQLSIAERRTKEGRGKTLTVILLLQGLFTLVLLSGIQYFFSDRYSPVVIVLSLAILILLLLSSIGIWKWRKIGVYALVFLFFLWLLEFFTFEVPNVLHSPLNKDIPVVQLIAPPLLWYIFGSAIYFWAIKRKWHLFA